MCSVKCHTFEDATYSDSNPEKPWHHIKKAQSVNVRQHHFDRGFVADAYIQHNHRSQVTRHQVQAYRSYAHDDLLRKIRAALAVEIKQATET
ncbi:uncharacterized protein EAF01_003803 [Botrytis porri]|uniref:uncharacterized protein n=1 Tax=Botrytis porri TaxID=87229 RepID=UPI0019029E15|nr:uncharacterized protein EAF01_003803 [Botrytis porri]KAF7908048.1 hypothetical protein EAF01_003803 [Botrytis porri]